jgi:hypothetical protein
VNFLSWDFAADHAAEQAVGIGHGEFTWGRR